MFNNLNMNETTGTEIFIVLEMFGYFSSHFCFQIHIPG